MDGESAAVFKNTPQGELRIHLYFPRDWTPDDHRPAILLFFGGGFQQGSPSQFTRTARYLAGRGMVAATPEYRVAARHHTTPEKSIEDAKSAVRWVRLNAARLGVDPARIVAGGGSAGGTCAALTALNQNLDAADEDKSISTTPAALVVYNPVLGIPDMDVAALSGIPDDRRTGVLRIISAWRVGRGDPPAILFFGTADALLKPARDFVEKYAAAGNRIELYTAEGQRHGFFNAPGAASGSEGWYTAVLFRTDEFLRSLSYLKGKPTTPDGGPEYALKKEAR